MPTDEVKQSIRLLIRLKEKILLSGGFSPASDLYEEFEFAQKQVLRAFRLRNTTANIKIINLPPLSFSYNKNSQQLKWCAEVPFDGTVQSRWKENARQYLQGTKLVHLKSEDEQVKHMYDLLAEKSRRLYDQDE